MKIKWNDADVHESLLLPGDVNVISVPGYVLHKTKKYFKQQKRPGYLKMFFSAIFSFIKNYFFKRGFLDGAAGYHCARINARYTFLKYKRLDELWNKKQ
jgi:hypothetical protein